MISLYTDEDVDVLIKPLLQAKGFNVLSTLDEGMLGKSDREQIEHAIKLHDMNCFARETGLQIPFNILASPASSLIPL